MKRRSAAVLLLLCLTAVLALTGCKAKRYEYEPETTSIFITEDGVIRECLKDTLDEAYLTKEGLEQFIREQVKTYNAGEPKEKVLLDSVVQAENSDDVIVRMTYASSADYDAFNYDEGLVSGLKVSRLETMGKAGISLKGAFVDARRFGDVPIDNILKKSQYIAVTGKAGPDGVLIYTEGNIRYVSANTTDVHQNYIRIPAGETFTLIYQ